MADVKITGYTEKTVLEDADLFEIVDSTTVSNKKAQLSNVGNRIFTARDTDDLTEGTNLYYTEVRVSANTDVTANTAKTGVTTEISNVVEDTTPQLGGDLDYNSNGTTIIGQTVGGADGDAVYLSGSNTWSQADASAEATSKDALGIRVSASIVLTQGVFTTTGLTAGALYYVSETAGAITATAPATSLSIVRPIAYALTTTELYVFPSGSYVENA